MKKKVVIILILIILIIAGVSLLVLKNKENQNVELTEQDVVLIGKEKYEEVLSYCLGKNIELSGQNEVDGISNPYEFDGKYYLKINNYSEIIDKTISNEFKSKFNSIMEIKEQDGEYYIDMEKNYEKSNYLSTQLVLNKLEENQITFDAITTYNGIETSTVSNKFIIKKENNNWKVCEFTNP